MHYKHTCKFNLMFLLTSRVTVCFWKSWTCHNLHYLFLITETTPPQWNRMDFIFKNGLFQQRETRRIMWPLTHSKLLLNFGFYKASCDKTFVTMLWQLAPNGVIVKTPSRAWGDTQVQDKSSMAAASWHTLKQTAGRSDWPVSLRSPIKCSYSCFSLI